MANGFVVHVLGLCLLAGMGVGPAAADVCELNSKAVTDRAMRHLKAGGVLQQHTRCDSCATTTTTKVTIATVDRKPSGSDFSIEVTGKTVEQTTYSKVIDLADTYVLPTKGAKRYANLGMLAKCPDVNEQNAYKVLPDNLVEK